MVQSYFKQPSFTLIRSKNVKVIWIFFEKFEWKFWTLPQTFTLKINPSQLFFRINKLLKFLPVGTFLAKRAVHKRRLVDFGLFWPLPPPFLTLSRSIQTFCNHKTSFFSKITVFLQKKNQRLFYTCQFSANKVFVIFSVLYALSRLRLVIFLFFFSIIWKWFPTALKVFVKRKPAEFDPLL